MHCDYNFAGGKTIRIWTEFSCLGWKRVRNRPIKDSTDDWRQLDVSRSAVVPAWDSGMNLGRVVVSDGASIAKVGGWSMSVSVMSA